MGGGGLGIHGGFVGWVQGTGLGDVGGRRQGGSPELMQAEALGECRRRFGGQRPGADGFGRAGGSPEGVPLTSSTNARHPETFACSRHPRTADHLIALRRARNVFLGSV